MNLYSEPESGTGEFFRIGAATFVACVLLAAISSYIRIRQEDQQFQYSRAYSLLFLPLSAFYIYGGRVLFRRLLRALSKGGIGQNRILFVGDSPLARDLAKA